MKKGKSLVLFGSLLILLFPQLAFAETVDVHTTKVGIGFEQAADTKPKPKEDGPIENVLPSTNLPSKTYYQSARSGRLPQTGDQLTYRLQMMGILCLMLVFWLFLFQCLKKEEEHNEKE